MSLFRRKKNRLDNGPGEFHQSGSYHRYFEGWAECETLNEKGKVCIQRTYVGDYHCVQMSGKSWLMLRLALWLLTGVSLFLFILGAIQDTAQNDSPILAVVQLAAVCGHIAMFFSLGNLRTKMTVYDYKAGPRALLKRSRITACLSGVCLLVTVVLSLVQGLSASSQVISMACFGISALISAAVAYIAHGLPIRVIPNDTPPPPGSVIIRRAGE